MNTDIKQRIAECIPYFQKQSAVGYNEGIVGRKAEELLRDCLKHIEELEQDYPLSLNSYVEKISQLQSQLQAVDKSHTALRLASEELIACVRHGDQEDIGEAMAKVEAILQPAQKEQ